MAGNFVHSRFDPANQRIVINVIDSNGVRVADTAEITLDLTLLTGTNKDMRPREVNVCVDGVEKKAWVLCTEPEDL